MGGRIMNFGGGRLNHKAGEVGFKSCGQQELISCTCKGVTGKGGGEVHRRFKRRARDDDRNNRARPYIVFCRPVGPAFAQEVVGWPVYQINNQNSVRRWRKVREGVSKGGAGRKRSKRLQRGWNSHGFNASGRRWRLKKHLPEGREGRGNGTAGRRRRPVREGADGGRLAQFPTIAASRCVQCQSRHQ